MLIRPTHAALIALVLVAGAVNALAAETVAVDISKLAYLPPEITLHIGDTVQWTNHDFVAHTATTKSDATGEAWDLMILPGKTVEWKAKAVGSVQYYCKFHPNMRGTITVLAN